MEEKIVVAGKRPVRRPSAVVINRRTWLAVRAVAISTSTLAVLLIVALAVLIVIKVAPPYCDPGLESKGLNLKTPGIFNNLTPREMVAVQEYLHAQTSLNLRSFENATVNSSYIFMMSLQMPLKSSVMKFIKGNDRKPKRTAKVILYRGDKHPPRVEEMMVGPLPKPRYHRVLTNPAYRRTPIPFSSRPVDAVERRELKAFLLMVTKEIHPLFTESYGLTYHNCTPGLNCLLFKDYAPRGTESGERMSWFWAYRETDGFYLHPLGFAIQVDHKHHDSSQWMVTRVIYNGQLFYEIEDLMNRYLEGTLRKITPIIDDVDAQFSTFNRRGHHSFDTPLRGPRLIEPDGHRYSLDDQLVSYFGWSFNYHMRTATGLQIFDVYFQGEKVAYELSLQDITAFHTGYSPETSWLALYGVSWLLGASSYPLMPGLDCPSSATFRDSYHFANTGSPVRYKNSICLFEQTMGMPLRRHYSAESDGKFSSYGGLVSSSLVVRTVISLWSCDYIVDYIFHLDGAIELKVTLTGYVQASFDLGGQRPYGNRVHHNVRGNLQQHLFHWKIDLDIADTVNRYDTLDIATESGASFWYEDTVNKTQLKFFPVLRQDENDAKVPFNFDKPRQHIIYSRNPANKYGAYRGYRVINEAMSKFLLQHSSVSKAAGWAKYQMAVTVHKDIEGESSSIYAQGDPYDPVVDFSRFVEDNDTVVDRDIVFWVTSGLYHIPHAEDVPSISTTSTQSRVLLTPYNFYNHCPSMAVSDALLVTRRPGGDSGLQFDTFGTSYQEPQCYQRETSIREFSGDLDEA